MTQPHWGSRTQLKPQVMLGPKPFFTPHPIACPILPPILTFVSVSTHFFGLKCLCPMKFSLTIRAQRPLTTLFLSLSLLTTRVCSSGFKHKCFQGQLKDPPFPFQGDLPRSSLLLKMNFLGTNTEEGSQNPHQRAPCIGVVVLKLWWHRHYLDC